METWHWVKKLMLIKICEWEMQMSYKNEQYKVDIELKNSCQWAMWMTNAYKLDE